MYISSIYFMLAFVYQITWNGNNPCTFDQDLKGISSKELLSNGIGCLGMWWTRLCYRLLTLFRHALPIDLPHWQEVRLYDFWVLFNFTILWFYNSAGHVYMQICRYIVVLLIKNSGLEWLGGILILLIYLEEVKLRNNLNVSVWFWFTQLLVKSFVVDRSVNL